MLERKALGVTYFQTSLRNEEVHSEHQNQPLSPQILSDENEIYILFSV